MKKQIPYFILAFAIVAGSLFLYGGSVAFGAALQNYNLGASGATNYEVGEAVWSGNVFQVKMRAGGTGVLRPVQITVGTNPGIYINTSGNTSIATLTFPYASSDNPGVTGGNPSANVVSVAGSVQLIGNSDAIVFGRGTSSFLKDEELAFGWGGGWYMTDGTYLRVRNNKTVYSTGGAEFGQPVTVGTPTTAGHATTKSYVDSATVGQSGWTDGGANVYLTTLGDKVGIGTASPGDKLEVNGIVRFSGSTAFGSNISGSGRIGNMNGNLWLQATQNQIIGFLRSNGSGTPVYLDDATGDFFVNSVTFKTGSSGNVGIGTTNPGTNKLHIYNGASGGSAYQTGGLVVESNTRSAIQLLAPNANDAYLFFGDVSAGNTGYVGHYGSTMSPANLMIYYSAGNHAFTGGNVGIGTTSPGAKLDVWGSAWNNTARIYSTGSSAGLDFYDTNGTRRGVVYSDSSGFGLLTNGASWAVRVNHGGNNIYIPGNVGIGSTSVAYKLDVTGTGSFTGTVTVGTPTAASHAATKSYVDSAAGGGVGAGTSGQTLRHNGTAWVANSVIYNNGTNVGIGTTSPISKLDVMGGGIRIKSGIHYKRFINVASYETEATTPTGILVIKVGTASTNIMSKIKISGWGYDKSWDVVVSGYMRPNYWDRVGDAIITGNPPFNANEVRLTANSGDNSFYIFLGTTATVWPYYTMVSVDVEEDYQNNINTTGWVISVQGVEPTTTNTFTPTTSLLGAKTIIPNNVGIGTTDPGSYKLYVNGNSYLNGDATLPTGKKLYFGGSNYLDEYSGAWGIRTSGNFAITGTLELWTGSIALGNNLIVKNKAQTGWVNFAMRDTSGAETVMNLSNIGTLSASGVSSFTQPVTVGAPTATGHAATKSYVDSATVGQTGWTDGGTSVYTTTLTDNVGIGTTSPVKKLQVHGDIALSNGGKIGQGNGWGTDGNSYSGTLELYNGATGYTTLQSAASYGLLLNPSGGNVGIGTTVPGAKLDIYTAGANTLRLSTNSHSNNQSLEFYSIAGAYHKIVSNAGSGNLQIRAGDGGTGHEIQFYTDGAYRGEFNSAGTLSVSGAGSFGQPVTVGTPTAASHAATKSYVDSAAGGGVGAGTSGQTLRHNGTAWIANSVIYNNGTNVGIGTTSPGSTLSVNGSFGADNGYKIVKLQRGDGATGSVRWYLLATLPTNNYRTINFKIVSSNNFTTAPPYGIDTIHFQINMWLTGTPVISHWIERNSSSIADPARIIVTNEGDGNIRIYNTTGRYGDATLIVETYTGINGTSYSLNPVEFAQGSSVPAAIAGSVIYDTNSNVANHIVSTGSIGLGTIPSYTLDVAGTGRFTQPVIVGAPTATNHAATKSYVDSAAGGGVGAGTSGQTLRHNGTAWVANSLIYNNGTNIGIGTTSPTNWIHVNNNRDTSSSPDSVGLTLESSVSTNQKYQLGVGVSGVSNQYFSLRDITAGVYRMVIATGGNVGIGTTSPGAKLDVVGSVSAQMYYDRDNTNYYIDPAKNLMPYAMILNGAIGVKNTSPAYDIDVTGTLRATGNWSLGGAAQTNLNLNGNNIVGVNKLTVTTIDPLYEIGGVKYSTYAPSIAGGVKEEYVGRGKLTASISKSQLSISNQCNNDSIENSMKIVNCKLQNFEYVIDFSEIEKGSDLWVWWKTVDFSKENVEVLATVYGVPVPISYEIEGNKIIFRSEILNTKYKILDTGLEFSYRLVGKRFDWKKWPTFATDQTERANLIVK